MPGNGYSFPVAETKMGVAIETTRGTAVTPKFWLPVRSPKYKVNLTEEPAEVLEGSMVKTYDLVPGLRYDGHGWTSYPYFDSFPVLVRAELGSADSLITASSNGKLATAAVKGATSIKTTVKPTVGTFVAIGPAPKAEGHKVTDATGTASPYTVTLATPLVYTQAKTATVKGLTGHKFSLLNNAPSTGNQPPSVTLTDFAGDQWRQIAAAQLDDLTLKGNATGLVDYTCTWFGNAATTPAAPSTSFTSTAPPPGWTFTATIGSGAPSPVVEWTFAFKRGVKPLPAITGTQSYLQYAAYELTPTGKLTVVAQSTEPELTAYEAGTQQPLDFTLFDVKEGFAMEIHSSKSQFKSGELDRSKEYVEVPLDLQLLPTATDATAGGVSPCTITVWNAQTTSY